MIEGKVANQFVRARISGDNTCAKCSKVIPQPKVTGMNAGEDPQGVMSALYISHYIFTPYYIYETKGGFAVTYCSKYCRDKHNHRFKR